MPTQTTANANTSEREAQPSNENNSAFRMPTYTTTNEDSGDKSDMEEGDDEEIDKSNKEGDKSDIPIHTILCTWHFYGNLFTASVVFWQVVIIMMFDMTQICLEHSLSMYLWWTGHACKKAFFSDISLYVNHC